MACKIRKVPSTPEELVQLRRREENPSKLYVASTNVNVNPPSLGLCSFYYGIKDTPLTVRQAIYRLAQGMFLGEMENGDRCSPSDDYTLINAFEIGPSVIDGSPRPVVFYHIPLESYLHANRDITRLEKELTELII